MNLVITHIQRTGQLPVNASEEMIHCFRLDFTIIADTGWDEILERFEQMGFETNPAVSRDARFMRVGHRNVDNVADLERLLREHHVLVGTR